MGDRFGTPGADGFLYIALFLRESQSQSESESQRALGKARPGVAIAGGAKVGGIAFPGLALPKARLSVWQVRRTCWNGQTGRLCFPWPGVASGRLVSGKGN
jgi:hypothetical protein